MISYRSEVTIARPPEKVWPYVIEPGKQALWTDVAMKPITDGPWRWLGPQPAAASVAALQAQLDAFRSRTTSSGRTGRSAGRRPARRTGRHPGHCPPARVLGATSASATTSPTARAP